MLNQGKKPESKGTPNWWGLHDSFPPVLPSLDSRAAAQNPEGFIRYRQKELQEKPSLSDLRYVYVCVCLGGGGGSVPFWFCFVFSVLPCPCLQATPWGWWQQCVGRCLKLQRSYGSKSLERISYWGCFSSCLPLVPDADTVVGSAQQGRETKVFPQIHRLKP